LTAPASPTNPPSSKPGPSFSNIAALPSRSGGPAHVLTLFPDKTVRCTCMAGQYDRACHRAKQMERRIRKVQAETLAELLTVKERVWNILYLHPDARDSDLACIKWYFEDFHGLDPKATWLDLLALIQSHYHGNVIETVRRRRQEWQAAGYFPPTDDAEISRRTKQDQFHAEFSQGAPA
jgi:hypothetical protein